MKRVQIESKATKKNRRGDHLTPRQKGTPNKTTVLLKDAILIACQQHGEDGNGKDELVGYLRMVAKRFPKQMCALLRRVLPYHVIGDLQQDALTAMIMQELMRSRGQTFTNTPQGTFPNGFPTIQ